MAKFIGAMENITKDSSKIINSMERENCYWKMAIVI